MFTTWRKLSGNFWSRMSNWASASFSDNVAALGLINIYTKADDPLLEKRILQAGASYGKQLGVLMDTTDYILQQIHCDETVIDVQRFRTMQHEIQSIKQQHKLEQGDPVNQAISSLTKLAETDPIQFEQILKQLNQLSPSNKTSLPYPANV